MPTTEVKLLKPIWVGGKPREAGEVVELDHAQAVYLEGLERVEIIPPAAPEAAELPGKPGAKAAKK